MRLYRIKKFLFLTALVAVTANAAPLEFQSTAVPKAVLYDAPSVSAKKIFLLSQYYPVEIIVRLNDWMKVRDAEGGINWIQANQLSSKRMLIVNTNQAELRSAADTHSQLLAHLQKGVSIELVDISQNNGWVKVMHRNGIVGFVLASSIWGLN